MANYYPGSYYGPTDGGGFEKGWRGPYLEAHLLSNVGKKRKNNEDSCLMCAAPSPEVSAKRGILFTVADGMGGANAGEHASNTSLRILSLSYFNSAYDGIPDALVDALTKANSRVFEEGITDPALAGMGTTVSALVLLGDWAYIAQVGDSRIYLLREHKGMRQLTQDHSLVAEQVREGLISAEEAENHSLKNLITRAVGIKDTVQVDLFAARVKEGDTLLICSDGLCNMMSDDDIRAALENGDLKAATHTLIQGALDGGGSDNITAVTVRVAATPPKTELQPGAELIDMAGGGFFAKLRGLFS